MNSPHDLDWETFFPSLVGMAVVWFVIGTYWYALLQHRCRAQGHEYHFRLPLQQWMVVALGLSIQLGLLVKFASTSQIGWGYFVLMPPFATWGLLDAIMPIPDRDPDSEHLVAPRKDD
ncbi:MAG: hypothetical protein HY291_19675 [Planctomycetes bacterium]|nr:hypothetical protein [Planctomycetota bacterium]